MAEAGRQALDALLTATGDSMVQFDELRQLLIDKGVITEAEWDERITRRYSEGERVAEWSRKCLNPEDNEALDAFFGGPEA